MTDEDIELTHLAAKAMGIRLKRWNETYRAFEIEPPTDWPWFNPLSDRNGALWLVSELRLGIEWEPGYVYVWRTGKTQMREQIVGHALGEAAARPLRRAIVRAAAEIGRAMP